MGLSGSWLRICVVSILRKVSKSASSAALPSRPPPGEAAGCGGADCGVAGRGAVGSIGLSFLEADIDPVGREGPGPDVGIGGIGCVGGGRLVRRPADGAGGAGPGVT